MALGLGLGLRTVINAGLSLGLEPEVCDLDLEGCGFVTWLWCDLD